MKFSCEKYQLSLAIATAGRAAASKSPIPSLEGLLIEAETKVKITGYDLKKGIYTSFEADVSAPGRVVISSRLFGDIVRKLPDGIVFISSDEYNMVNIKSGNSEYNITGISPDDYPDLPVLDSTVSFTINQEAFASMISETSFAISNNESRPVYTGALLEVENNVLTMVAVDGYRMALRREALEAADLPEMKVIVPGNALSDLEKISLTSNENIRIYVGTKHVGFYIENTVLISRRLDGEFLNYKKTVPSDFAVQVKAKRDDLIRSADRVSLIIDDRSKNPLRCLFGTDVLSIDCATPLGRAEDSCPIIGDGKGLVIGFNNSYFLDALKAAPAESLMINLNSGSSPCVITPDDQSNKFLYMVLPVRLRSAD